MNFERGKDPLEALDLGIFQERSFNDDFEAGSYIMKILPALIKKANDPSKSTGEIVEEYIAKYITVKYSFIDFKVRGMADPSLVWLVRQEIDRLPYKICKKYGIRKR
ncbi:MAG TPA: hypothetical protein PKK07_03080 [bacterium]|nr:hypothetical protein [bacterium]